MLKIWNQIIYNSEDKIQLTISRTKALKKAFEFSFDKKLINWTNFCKAIISSKFLMGEVTNFKASLDWAIKEENIQKILEGSYNIGDRIIKKDNNKMIVETLQEEEKNIAWKNVKHQLREKYGDSTFKSWFSKLTFVEIKKGEGELIAPTRFIRDWIETYYSNVIKDFFKAEGIKTIGLAVQSPSS